MLISAGVEPTYSDKDGSLIEEKREIEALLATHETEIADGQMKVLLLDECYLLMGRH